MTLGLEYLTLDRLGGNTLSGGEAQRIQLATSLGSRLVGALYVLDERCIDQPAQPGHCAAGDDPAQAARSGKYDSGGGVLTIRR